MENQVMTPSVYAFVMRYVHENDLAPEDGLDAYYELPWKERQRLHVEMLEHLKQCLEDPGKDVNEFLDYNPDEEIENLIYEEEGWRGGWEKGESDTEV